MKLKHYVAAACIAACVLGHVSRAPAQNSGEDVFIEFADGLRASNPGLASGQRTNTGNRAGGTGIMTTGPDGKEHEVTIAELRKKALDSLKTQLGVRDDEWAVMLPKIELIQSLAFDAGIPQPRVGTAIVSTKSTSDVWIQQQGLRAAVESGMVPDNELKLKMTALREARRLARSRLLSARKELSDIVTTKQEGILLEKGILE